MPSASAPRQAADVFHGLYDHAAVSGGGEAFAGVETRTPSEQLRLGAGGGAHGEASLRRGLAGDAGAFLGLDYRYGAQDATSGPGLGLRNDTNARYGVGAFLGAAGQLGPNGAGARGEAFLGARAGLGGGLSLTNDGRTVGGGRVGGELLLGAGVMGGGSVRAEGGQLDVDAHAGAAVGIGAQAGGGFSINPGNLARAGLPSRGRATGPGNVFGDLYDHTDAPGHHERFFGLEARSGGARLRAGAGGEAAGHASLRRGIGGEARGFAGWEYTGEARQGANRDWLRAGAGGWLGGGANIGPRGAGAHGEAFLGARVGGGVERMGDLGGGRMHGGVLVGAGAMGGGSLRNENGRLDVDANAGVALGVGAEGGGGVSIDHGNLGRRLPRL